MMAGLAGFTVRKCEITWIVWWTGVKDRAEQTQQRRRYTAPPPRLVSTNAPDESEDHQHDADELCARRALVLSEVFYVRSPTAAKS